MFDIPKPKDFSLMELEDSFVLFSNTYPKGKVFKTDAELLASILDIDIPILKDEK